MDIEAVGNGVSMETVGNKVDVLLIDIRSEPFFLTTLQTSADHKEVESI